MVEKNRNSADAVPSRNTERTKAELRVSCNNRARERFRFCMEEDFRMSEWSSTSRCKSGQVCPVRVHVLHKTRTGNSRNQGFE